MSHIERKRVLKMENEISGMKKSEILFRKDTVFFKILTFPVNLIFVSLF